MKTTINTKHTAVKKKGRKVIQNILIYGGGVSEFYIVQSTENISKIKGDPINWINTVKNDGSIGWNLFIIEINWNNPMVW